LDIAAGVARDAQLRVRSRRQKQRKDAKCNAHVVRRSRRILMPPPADAAYEPWPQCVGNSLSGAAARLHISRPLKRLMKTVQTDQFASGVRGIRSVWCPPTHS